MISKGRGRRAQRAFSDPLEPLERRSMLSASYIVAPSGSDAGPGTLNQPFRTIQEAANVANWGDTVLIRAGTYHETVKPPHGGVTFSNYNGESVTISGADRVSGFSSRGNSIYSAFTPINWGEGGNQIFVDGQMVNEARWPNTSLDPSHPTRATVGAFSNSTIYDASLQQPAGYWNGATIHITPGDGWVSYTGLATNSGPGWVQVSLPALSAVETPVAGNSYYLSGKFQALDSPGEWYIDNSSTLYLRTPGSDDPVAHDVEAKARQFGFDLANVPNVTLRGINFFSCTVRSDWNSSNTVIDGITARYISDFTNLYGSGWAVPQPSGIELWGAGSILENSDIGFSAGDGVYIGNANIRVTNNSIHDIDYAGVDGAGVRAYGFNQTIDHNLIYNAGRDGINYRAQGGKVVNNTLHDFMLQTYDGGGIYVFNVNGLGAEIGSNTIYNAHTNNFNGLDAVGIMLDGDSLNFTVDNNITDNVDAGFKADNTSRNELVYGNKFGGTQFAIESNGWVGFAFDWSGSQFHDNVYYNPNIEMGANAAQWNNQFSAGSPLGNVSPPAPPAPPSPLPPAPVTAPPPVTPPARVGSPATRTWQAVGDAADSYNVVLGGTVVGYTKNGSWVRYNNVDFGSGGLSQFQAAVAVPAPYDGQRIEVHADSLDGPLIASLTTYATPSWSYYYIESASLSPISGVHDLYVKFVGTNAIANLLWIKFA